MSSCGGNCGCGSGCKCGNGCGCGMYPDMENNMNITVVQGIAPMKAEAMSQKSYGAEGGNGCKCGSNCLCNPCNC